MNTDRVLFESLLRIKNDPSLSPFVDWLNALRDNARDRLETATDNLQVEQGKAQAIKKILDAIESAPSVLEKLAK